MGVTGLWTVVKPCARPIKLETLNRQRLAVDASIWIYQFLKAVRDKEGNALRNSHVVGFFRRICKLLYYGIKPVFVFDGGAPTLKRETISARHRRREGRREDAVRTAGRLLAVQIQRLAEEEEEKRRRERRKKTHPHEVEEEPVPENPVYVEELMVPENERKKTTSFRKQDQYHLPEMETSLEDMGAPNDPRIMSRAELEEYARQFNSGEDVNLYDFSKIDYDSPFFLSLPSSDRYNILNAARLRSRIRMGYTREQLETMFPDRMAFSRFQIERVKERNDLTQRLMNINGMNDTSDFTSQRIAGERGREYVLVKGDEREGGWVLGVLSKPEEGKQEKPIDVEKYTPPRAETEDSEEEEFEDVPIPGFNRPLLTSEHRPHPGQEMAQTAEGFDDSLFVGEEIDTLFEESRLAREDEDQDLQRAIQMSLERSKPSSNEVPAWSGANVSVPYRPSMTSDTAMLAPVEEEEDEGDLFSALSKTRVPKAPRQPIQPLSNPFGGPLPFESLKFEFKRKPTAAVEDETAGGFERDVAEVPKVGDEEEKRSAQPLPPWFEQRSLNESFIESVEEEEYPCANQYRQRDLVTEDRKLHDNKSADVINLVDEDEETKVDPEVVDLASSDEDFEDVLPPYNLTAEPAQRVKQEQVTPPAPGEAVVPAIEAPIVNEAVQKTAQDIQSASAYKLLEGANNATPGVNNLEIQSPPLADLNISAGELNAPSPRVQVPQELTDEPTAITSTDLPESVIDPTVAEARYPKFEFDYSDPEEDDLLAQLAEEAEEHARFASTLNAKPQAENARDFETELRQLRSQQAKDRRDADEVSHIMVQECQQLLRLFGIPYITAPMEAEAQCAELVRLGLVDGIVTDDSDVFLFGGTRIYKNMFNQAKFVECYLSTDLENEYGLTREKLIRFAHLLGSDYTEGIPNVGPVTALEILTEFDTLEEFRDWWTQVQRGAKLPDDEHSAFRRKFRKILQNSYLKPEVDDDRSGFKWGVPDLPSLRTFLMSTVGWSPQRTDEVLLPVIRDINRREQEGTQSNITTFFEGQLGAGVFAPRRRGVEKSRMQKAFGRLKEQRRAKRGGSPASELRSSPISVAEPIDENNGTRESPVDDVETENKVAPVKNKRKSRGPSSVNAARKRVNTGRAKKLDSPSKGVQQT
ncbi:DNA repair protein rad2 [Ascosphaera pollenicola]|nr:DNA repair protein rad2 [Ascosphaera pollenicola]